MSRRAFPRIAISLFLVFLIPSGTLFVAVGYLVYQQRLVEIRSQVATVAQVQSVRGAELVSAYLSQTQLLADDKQMIADLEKYLADPSPQRASLIENHLDSAMIAVATHVGLFSLSIYSDSGHELFRRGQPAPAPEDLIAYVDYERAIDDAVSLTAAFLHIDGSRVFRLEKPLFVKGKQIAVFRLELVQRELVTDLLNVEGSGRYYVVGPSDAGRFIYFSDVIGTQNAFLSEVAPFVQRFLSDSLRQDNQVSAALIDDSDGITYYVAAVPVPQTPWFMVAEQPIAPVLLTYARRLVVVALGLVLIGAISTIIITRMYSARVMNLSNKVSAFLDRNPQFSPPTAARSMDELANLTNVTMAVLDHIEKSRNRLRATVRNTSQALSEAEQELRTLDEKLIQSAKLAAIGEVTTGIAHELNQPLGALRLKLELLRRIAVAFENHDAIAQIDDALEYVHRMTRLTMNLRRTSRSSDQEISAVNLVDCVYRAADLFSLQFERANIRLSLPSNRLVVLVHGNAEWLEQIVINLLANARDALAGTNNPMIEISCNPISTGVELWVTDNGAGIADIDQHMIFDAFYTSKQAGEGTGLGLSICRRLLARMDGSLRLDETYKDGARFVVVLQHANIETDK